MPRPTGADQRLPGSCRLAGPHDYGRVFEKPCVRIPLGRILVLARKGDADCPRLGLVVSRRALRRASSRNRFKRLVRESFRRHRGRMQVMDLVVIARRGVDEWPGRDVSRALERGWRRLAS